MEAGLGWMTPHTWWRTYATILHDEFGLSDRQKADLMGHAKISMMKDACQRQLKTDPLAASEN
jgi:integrase